MQEKLTFGLPFQEAIIKFALNNSDGYKVLQYVRNQNFALLEHATIYYTVEKAHKKWGRIPSQPFILELLEETFQEREFANSLGDDDRKEIRDTIDILYKSPAKDGDILLEQVAKFGSFVELKDTLERVDLTDYESYNNFSTQVQKAIDIADTREEKGGIFLIKDIRSRQMRRQEETTVIPTPWRQVNSLTSAGGYEMGSIIVIMDRPKNLKSYALVQFARGYMRMRKKVLFIDLENGEHAITMRLEQSVAKVDKKTLLKGGETDKKVQKVLRRYKRMGGEVYTRRLPAYSTTATIQAVIDEVYREEGIRFDVLIIDYIALMNSLGRKKETDETTTIGQAYVDVANLALKNKFEHVVTAMHVVRSAYARSETCYQENDIAKAIDIIRHAHAIYGLNRTEEEREAGIVRMEVVAQRDGVPRGRAYFNADVPIQRWEELTKNQIKEIEELMGAEDEREEPEYKSQRKKGDM